MRIVTLLLAPIFLLMQGCGNEWNNPYPGEDSGANVLYSAFGERPKHLDPVQAYAEDEYAFLGNIYEPPLQYHYLQRPYVLVPATATRVPKPVYLDAKLQPLPESVDASRIAFTDYVVELQPGIRYAPHPAFAKTEEGRDYYFPLDESLLRNVRVLADFKHTGTRELIADDYVYNIKRLAHPHLHSPVLGLMSEYIVGLSDFAAQLKENGQRDTSAWLDLNKHELAGAVVLDRYRYRIRIKGKYPQFLYWLAMPFFSPMPWEADRFHSQPGMAARNLTLDWYPVGTGAYALTENNPNARMVLSRNPFYRHDTYPCEGEASDVAAGLLVDCGKKLPFIDKVVFTREKEQIPYWNKFLQGYYDASGINSDSFDQAVQIGSGGEVTLTESMRAQGIQLSTSVATSSMYMGFNMLDPVFGGTSESARKLRQALSIALDQEEFISIFANGRGVAAQGPIPPGIFGFVEGQAGINPVVYEWKAGQPQRKPIEIARRLLAEAGYPNGRHQTSGEPLIVNLDTTGAGVGAKARVDWLTKQLQKIDVQLVVRSTDFNRFQEKIRKGAVQLFYFGWNADYPDPENFLFLLYGPQGKVKHGGENAANYSNPEYDRLFEQVRSMDNGPERQRLIDAMLGILRVDAPWIWGFHPVDYTLRHIWLGNRKPNKVAHNTLKYQRIDVARRLSLRAEWNAPQRLPLLLLPLGLILLVLPAWMGWRVRERMQGAAKP